MTAYTRSFEPVNPEVMDKFVGYAGGFAAGLQIRLHNAEGITAHELRWLEINTTGSRNPDAMCQQLIDRYTLQCVTTKLKS